MLFQPRICLRRLGGLGAEVRQTKGFSKLWYDDQPNKYLSPQVQGREKKSKKRGVRNIKVVHRAFERDCESPAHVQKGLG